MTARRAFLAAAFGLCTAVLGQTALARPVTLSLHQFLPRTSTAPQFVLDEWIRRVEEDSDGQLRINHYPSMQLGGTPPTLFDQAKDGVVDIIWTVLGYTPGRFPKSEVFEMPFLVTNGEDTSVAFQKYVEENAMDEFAGVHLIAVHTHGPGLFHTKNPVNSLEDLKGMKIRGGSRVISDILGRLGAEPIGMPVPAVTEALSKGVIDGTTIPWEVTPSLKVSELVKNHTGFSGTHGLYTQTFAFVMNKDSYDKLPDDLKALIDANSGVEVARAFGKAMDEGDAAGLAIAEKLGNNIVTLDDTETARWKAAAQPTIDQWFSDMQGQGIDGKALYEKATALVEAETGM